jgi:hypothetical protein
MERPFGWLPCRLLTAGVLRRLEVEATALYLALCLAADRQGLSFWGDERLGAQVGLDLTALKGARGQLQEHDLVAFDGRVYQVLSLPEEQPRRASPREQARRRGPARVSDPEHVAALLAPLMKKLGGG